MFDDQSDQFLFAKSFEVHECAIFFRRIWYLKWIGIWKDAKYSICLFFHAARIHVRGRPWQKSRTWKGGVHKLWRPPCLSRGVAIGRAKKQESIPCLSAPTRVRFSPHDETARAEIRHFSCTIWESSAESFRVKNFFARFVLLIQNCHTHTHIFIILPPVTRVLFIETYEEYMIT